METIFDESVRNGLKNRISLLETNCKAGWGKMNPYQMIRHMNLWNQWVLGIDNKVPYKQSLLGKIIGKFMLKLNTKDERPFAKNVPAGAVFTIQEKKGDFELQKQRWMELTESYSNYDNPDFIHGLFGKMTKEQIGVFVFKHYDHHLRQFGV